MGRMNSYSFLHDVRLTVDGKSEMGYFLFSLDLHGKAMPDKQKKAVDYFRFGVRGVKEMRELAQLFSNAADVLEEATKDQL